MGTIINDKNFLNENIFRFEKRLESQYTIFTDKTPTFVTYYHINDINSTTDTGLLNVDRIIGNESPLKYQEIKDFPIYGIDQIKLDLNDEEEGLTGSYEGEGIILPNTIKPLPNDLFTISYLDYRYLFMVTSMDYDTIKSNNYYKINFTLRSADPTSIEELNNQVLEKYNCIFANIGTEDNCLIREDAYEQLVSLHKIYRLYVDKYMSMFYNKRYNSFLINMPNYVVYDKFLSNFITKNKLLCEKDSYTSIVLSNEDYGEQFDTTYELSIYDAIENCKIDELDYVRYELTPITYPHSIFLYYNLKNIKSLTFVPDHVGSGVYIPDNIIDGIRNNTYDDLDILSELLVRFFNNSIESIFQIDMDKLKAYKITYTPYNYIMIPIILFILQYYNEKFLHM